MLTLYSVHFWGSVGIDKLVICTCTCADVTYIYKLAHAHTSRIDLGESHECREKTKQNIEVVNVTHSTTADVFHKVFQRFYHAWEVNLTLD